VAPDGWANLEVRTVGLLPWLHLCWSVLVCAWLSQESLTSGLLGGRVLGVVDLELVVFITLLLHTAVGLASSSSGCFTLRSAFFLFAIDTLTSDYRLNIPLSLCGMN